MKNAKPTYGEALAEVKEIVEKLNDPNFDLDQLSAQLKRATELLQLCKSKLHKAESEVAKILEEE